MWYYWLIGFIGLLILYGEVLRINYLYNTWKRKLGRPKFSIQHPFGIKPIIQAMQHNANNVALQQQKKVFDELVKGETFVTQLLGGLTILTNDPENIKAVLATQFSSFDLGLRYYQALPLLGNGVFTLSGHGWKHSRAMLRPQFARDQVGQLESVDNHVSSMIDRLDEANDRNEYADMQHLFHLLTIDTATEFLFAESVDSLNSSQKQSNGVTSAEFVESYQEALKWTLKRIFAQQFYWLIKPKTMMFHVERARRFVGHFADQAIKHVTEMEKKGIEEQSGYTFSYELAKVTKDRTVIIDQSFNILLAGRDTTASALSYCIYFMGHRPEVWTNLRNAIIEDFGIDGNDSVTFETLKRCKYLTWVINEVLRLQPIVPRNFRTATRATTLPRGGGPNEDQPIFVPKGSQVLYSAYVLQRNPKYWGEDADEFKPERWADAKAHNWDYVPFNGGPRICLGQQFALTEMSYTLMRLARKYDRIELENPNSELLHTTLLTSSLAEGLNAKMHIAPDWLEAQANKCSEPEKAGAHKVADAPEQTQVS